MINYRNVSNALGLTLLLSVNIAFSNNAAAAEFFASNNAKEIDLHTAYDRLMGQEQSDLKNTMVNILQKNGVKQGTFEDILGTYRMSSDQNITADNTEKYNTAPQDDLPDDKILLIAQEMAVSLNQDSIAVLIPNQAAVGDITVNFVSSQPSINDIVKILQDKLPPVYSQAFSMHLLKDSTDFTQAKVTGIEWLGSKINLEEIKKAFPLEKINSDNGKVYLVYQNGHYEQQ
jgi:hypothetical protein